MKILQNLFFLIISISIISCSGTDDDINSESSANTVDLFPEFSLNSPYLAKVVDENNNLFIYTQKSGKYTVAGAANFSVKRNNSLIKVSPSGKLLNENAGVTVLSQYKIAIGADDVIYMKTPNLSVNSIVKMDKNGKFITSNPIKAQTTDIDADENGNYFVLEPTLKKYSKANKLLWTTDLGRFAKRLFYSKSLKSIFVASYNELLNIDSSNGKLIWKYSIDNFDCNNRDKVCRPPFVDFDENGNTYLAYNRKGIKNNKSVTYIRVVKLDKSGKALFSKDIRSNKDFIEDIFLTGFSYFGKSFYMAVNSTTRKSSFNAEKAYIGKFDSNSGNEVWRQAPNYTYKKIEGYKISDFKLSTSVYIKDLVQNKKTGKIWCSIALGLPTRIKKPDKATEYITKVVVSTKFGSKTNEQTFVLNNIIYRNISSLNP